MFWTCCIGCVGLILSLSAGADAADAGLRPEPVKGSVRFKPSADEKNAPEQFRLNEHDFDFEMELQLDLTRHGFKIYDLRFPSPVKTKWKENNTVHAEYYQPVGKGPFPSVVVLDILAGDQVVSRMQAVTLAKENIAALVVYMPLYGPRRPKGERVHLLDADMTQTMSNIRQTVLDVRRSAAWLESRPEVDSDKLGILGTSLGSFMAALSAAAEPRFKSAALLLGGGGFAEVIYEDPRAAPYRAMWEWLGGSKATLAAVIAPADPITYAARLKERRVLMINAKRDDVVPPKASEALWKALGQPKIVWFDGTHVGAALFVIPAMDHVIKHFK